MNANFQMTRHSPATPDPSPWSWRRACAVLSAGLLLCATSVAAPTDLAPTGVLRAAFLGSNPAQGHVDPKTGEITGVVADMVKEMARRLGLRYEIYPAANAADIIKRLNEHQSDIGFLAYDAKRAKDVAFSDSYALMYNAFVVAADSPITATAQVDLAGVKVAAVRGQTQQIVLSETLRNASMTVLEKKPNQQEIETMLASGQVHAYGANRADAEQVAASSAGKLKALPDNFMVVEQAIVTPIGETPKMVEINALVDELATNGFVEGSLARTRMVGMAVARGSKR